MRWTIPIASAYTQYLYVHAQRQYTSVTDVTLDTGLVGLFTIHRFLYGNE